MTTTASRRVPVRAARGAAAALVGALGLVLGACSSPAPAPEPTPSTSTVVVQPTIEASKSAAPTPSLAPTWPLTGGAGDVVNRPAIAVKIENTNQARPQSGLEAADVVWETIIEFDVSRLVAVFQSQSPQEVGPIRSVRPMDIPIAQPYQGMLAFSGGQGGILDLAYGSGLQILSHDAGNAGFHRTSDRPAPHNVYGSLETFWGQADAGRVAPPQQFVFARTAAQASAATGGAPATNLDLRLSGASHPSWAWDAGSGTWLRSEDGKPATSAAGPQLSAVNVVAVVAPHPRSGFGAQNGASIPTYTLVGNGQATLATGGKTLSVAWSKAANDAPLVLTLPDGSPATLAPGNTWVELVPAETGTLTVS